MIRRSSELSILLGRRFRRATGGTRRPGLERVREACGGLGRNNNAPGEGNKWLELGETFSASALCRLDLDLRTRLGSTRLDSSGPVNGWARIREERVGVGGSET